MRNVHTSPETYKKLEEITAKRKWEEFHVTFNHLKDKIQEKDWDQAFAHIDGLKKQIESVEYSIEKIRRWMEKMNTFGMTIKSMKTYSANDGWFHTGDFEFFIELRDFEKKRRDDFIKAYDDYKETRDLGKLSKHLKENFAYEISGWIPGLLATEDRLKLIKKCNFTFDKPVKPKEYLNS